MLNLFYGIEAKARTIKPEIESEGIEDGIILSRVTNSTTDIPRRKALKLKKRKFQS